MEKVLKFIGGVVLVLAIIALIVFIGGWITMIVWNFIAGYFGFKQITLVVAIVINIALAIVAGAFKKGRS